MVAEEVNGFMIAPIDEVIISDPPNWFKVYNSHFSSFK
jgi:hypothetical protein